MLFENIEELISFKAQMKNPPKGNVPLSIQMCNNAVQISARLVKNGRLAHDPNIGAISGIAAALRKLGFREKIEIISHGLAQEQIGEKNKFIQIANLLSLSLQGIEIPTYKIIRSVVLYGGDTKEIIEVEIGFLLNAKGEMILGVKAPKIFITSLKNLLDFWKNND